MKIIYYYWGELIEKIALREMNALGIEIYRIAPERTKYDYDTVFMSAVKKALNEYGADFDAIFSFNYFPDLSRVAMECSIKYISWVYDSPHLTLESLTLCNPCNKVLIFDYILYAKYAKMGIDTVYYLPLPSRIVDRGYYGDSPAVEYKHDITFLGSLYTGEQDQFGQIVEFDDFIAGYLNALIQAQQKVYGADILDALVDDSIYSKTIKNIKLSLGEEYRNCDKEIFLDMMRRRVTMNERIEALTRIGNICRQAGFGGCALEKNADIDLYCGTNHPEIPVNNRGFADYYVEMPEIFYTSKINLNITLRSIQSGIPLRVMDILGAGGFCITNYQPEIEEYFENGVDLVWYDSIEDLIYKCDYYLRHEAEREQIARNGQAKVKALFSYQTQLSKIMELFVDNNGDV